MKLLSQDRLKSAQLLLFSLLVFLVASNLFLKFFVSFAYVNGILVDYLIVKLYLSDIFMIILLGLWFLELGWQKLWQTLYAHKKIIALVAAFAIFHLLAHLSSAHLVSSVWMMVKLIECWAFLPWIVAHKSPKLYEYLFSALISAVVFQSVLGGYQYLAQRPFFGYWFFGEPMFSFDPTVAKSTHPGALAILPYGTTTHPNVLAGIVVMFSLYALYLAGIKSKPGHLVTALSFIVVSGVVAWIAESGTAMVALGIGMVMYLVARLGLPKWKFIIEQVVIAVAILIAAGIPLAIFIAESSLDSVVRRRELQVIAIRMIQAKPWFGVGINQFTTALNEFGTVSGTLRFLQPVHNIPLLWLSETGAEGLLFLILIVIIVHKKYSVNFVAFTAVGLPLLLIGSLDHYLLSVQSGLLMSTIFIAEMLEKRKELHR